MILREAQRTTLQRADNARGTERRALRLQTGGLAENGVAEVLIHNLSATGALVETTAQLEPGDSIELDLPHAGKRKAAIVWSDNGLYGCQFEQTLSRAMISAALLRSDPRAMERDDEALALAALHEEWAAEDDSTVEKMAPARRLWLLGGLTFLSWAVIIALGFGISLLL